MRSAKRHVSATASGAVAEQPRHLLRRLQMTLGIGLELTAGRLDGDVLADAGEHILQVAPLGRGDRARR